MQDWLEAFTIEAGGKTFQPYDPEITLRIAETVRRQFDGVPEDARAIRRSFGYGWWAQNLEAATLLLEDAGFEKQGDHWYMPNGERFSVELGYSAEGVLSRLGSIIVQQWIQAGVDATSRTDPQFWDQMFMGEFDTQIGWSVETWGRATPTCRSSWTVGTPNSSPSPVTGSRRATGSAGRTPIWTGSSRKSAQSTSTIRAASSSGRNS